MNHVLKLATLDAADPSAAYTQPSRPLAPALIDGIKAFFDSALKH